VLGEEQVESFHRDGLLILREFLGPEELDLLQSDVDRVIESGIRRVGEGHGYRLVDGRDQYYRTDGIWGYGAALRSVTVRPGLLAAVGQCIGHPFLPINDSIVVKLPRSGVPIPWHQDPPYQGPDGLPVTFGVPNFTVDIYLDHTTETNGCLYGIAGHHLVGHVEVEQYGEEELFSRPDSIPIEMEPGDILFHSTTTPHGSRANQSDDTRRVIYIHYMAREVLEAMHPEWMADKPGFSDAGIETARAMIEEAGVAADLERNGVRLGDNGFEFVGDPGTPPFLWDMLGSEMAPDQIEAKKRLLA